MKELEKMAQKDAYDWARAEMFFGEGAGTRRKLLWAELYEKKTKIPGYADVFEKAYQKQNFAEHAVAASKERQRIDSAAKVSKNFRALRRGSIAGLSNGVFLAVGVVYVAHVTGYDKVVEAEMKKGWRRLKEEVQVRKDGRRIRLVREATYNATNKQESPREDGR